MPRCFVTNCGNYYSKTKSTDVIYHVFPNCKKLAIQWMILCAKETQGQPPKYARVCSNHFSSDCYQRDLQHELLGLPIRKKLKPEAVPDLHLPKLKPTKRKYRIDSQIDEKNKHKKENKPDSKKNCSNRKEFIHYGSVIVKTEPKLELPVRSSIRIAKRRSIEHISGAGNDDLKIETYKDENNFGEKIKFMTRLHLKLKSGAKQQGEEENVKIREDAKEDNKRDESSKCESGTTSSVAPAEEGHRLMPCLNRMHVMEDVEEGCDVSGALPSSPGHAEQRPDPPKSTPELLTLPPIQTPPPTENGLPVEEVKPSENGEEAASPETTETSQEVQEQQQQEVVVEEEEQQPKEKVTEQIQEEATTNNKNEPEKIEVVIEIMKTSSPVAADIQKESVVKGENEEDSTSSDSSPESVQSSNKRKIKEEDSASVTPTKKLRTQIQQQYINHDRILTEYIETSGCVSVEDLQVHTEQLLAEIRTLNELARDKEREWNNILHVKKVKEELLLRMQRKKQIMLMNSGVVDKNDLGEWDVSGSDHQDTIADRGKDGCSKQLGMMVPDVSSSPAESVSSRSGSKETGSRHDKVHPTKQRSILPKSMGDLNGQGECRQGRQGPILDVRSIIADYRQRHPETVPRRGRRQKSVLHTANNDASKGNILSMASLALGSGSQVRHGTAADMSNELGLLLSAMDSARQENSRPSSADSSVTSALGGVDAATSFKDVLVQFARLSQSERQELHAAANLTGTSKPPPPPYPEVTLHPVPPVVSSATVPTSQNSSLLHGILTKSQPRSSDSKPATFSPTLARLLTAPERVSNNNVQAVYTAALNSGVSISDLLSTGKSRNEITITPVGQYGQNTKSKDEDIDEDEVEDASDRLVIDEGTDVTGSDRNRTDNGSEAGDEVPQCQGCHQKSAQFVCAGCGNQWYCSRDCQVAAWDEHSEVCSG